MRAEVPAPEKATAKRSRCQGSTLFVTPSLTSTVPDKPSTGSRHVNAMPETKSTP